jgi:plastocyanin
MIALATLLFAAHPFVSCDGVISGPKGPLKDAVIWIESDRPTSAMKVKVEQKDKTFLPHITVVTTGSTVSFPNRDDLFHNVFAEYRAKKFDLGMYPKGQTRSVVFDKTGVVSVLCNVHSNMSAYVVVVDTPFFAKTNAKGAFSIPNAPSGKHQVKIWHESGILDTQSLEIGPGMQIRAKR